MRRVLLALICFSLIFATASAIDFVVPGDADGDMIVSDEEVELAEQSCSEGKITSDELEVIEHIHDNYPITIVDSADRTLTIYKPVKTIIPMGWSQCEPIFVLGSADKIAGIRTDLQEAYAWIPGIEDKQTIGGWNSIDYEKIVELWPDIVISSSTNLDALESNLCGIPYVILFRTLDRDAYDRDLKLLAKILEREERCDEFFSWRQDYIDLLKERSDKIGSEDRIRVYCESSDLPFYVAAKSSGANDVISIAGGINIAGNIVGNNVDVDPEWVIEENPVAIVITASLLNEPPESYLNYNADEYATKNLDEYLNMTCNRTAIKETDAAKQGRIYLLQGNYAEFGRSRGIIGACYMAKWFHPELFEDLDPEKPNREYFEEWLGVPYHGIWAYPKVSA